MKYFEVDSPYYALIKAEDKDHARVEYNKVIAYLGPGLMDKIKEISRDQALNTIKSYLPKEVKKQMSNDVIDNYIDSDGAGVLIIDQTLLEEW